MRSFRGNLGYIGHNVHSGMKTSSLTAVTMALKVFTGLVIGLVFAIAMDEIFAYGTMLFVFVVMMSTLSILRISWRWNLMTTLIFDLFCILLGTLLRVYIVVAPGA